jgi:two-component system, response regulator YesN
MLKVIIADDEIIIREGLKDSIKWDKLGLELLGCVKNGVELLNLMETSTPDICLIDICMPKINGLELIKRIRAIDPNIICIVITGHDEFDYAHEAIKLNVFDYILKPVNESMLNKCLSKAINKINERINFESELNRANEILAENMDLLLDKFLNAVIDGQYSLDEIKQYIDFHELKLGDSPAIVIMNTKNLMKLDVESDERKLQGEVYIYKEMLGNKLGDIFSDVYLSIDDYENIFGLINIGGVSDWEEKISKIEEYFKDSINQGATLYKQQINQGLDNAHVHYHQILQESVKVYSDVIDETKKYVDKNYADCDLSFKDIADRMSVSVSYLSKQFKKEIGLTFVEYLTKLRIKNAVVLLKTTDYRINEISEKVGYNTQHYFCVVFKRVMGVSPNNYLKSDD